MVNALNLVSRPNGEYVPPKRKYVGGAGLVACRNGIQAGLVGIKASWKRTGVTVSSDMMTDRNGRPQANLLLVNDFVVVFTDCVECLMEKKTGDVGKMGWAKRVVDKGGEISSFFRNHHWTRGYLRTPDLVEGTVLQALKPAGTRFGTQQAQNVRAISQLCAMRATLTSIVLSDLWKEWAVGERKPTCEKFSALVFDAVWWKTAEFFTALLKLPYKATRQTDGHAVGMMGKMCDVMLQLTEDVGDLFDEDAE
ncbi:unnamed protein product [Closterium sp. Yama58-4]|nr:unnamed protein product [Closterium sp. Yama58-4]